MGFIRDTLEKVYRLADILEFMNFNPILKDNLALKGGTAINLTIFNLPRLSVDIDLDYLRTDSREEMLQKREIINKTISKYMIAKGYTPSSKSKNPHSLDSWIYDYTNAGGNRDNIKIEINYSMRAHIFPAKEMKIITEYFASESKIKCLSTIEIFGSKINAAKEINKSFDISAIDTITKHKIRTDLLPVMTKKETLDLDRVKEILIKYIKELMSLNPQEIEFLKRFENKEYAPELLFHGKDISERIKAHPMALWKIKQ